MGSGCWCWQEVGGWSSWVWAQGLTRHSLVTAVGDATLSVVCQRSPHQHWRLFLIGWIGQETQVMIRLRLGSFWFFNNSPYSTSVFLLFFGLGFFFFFQIKETREMRQIYTLTSYLMLFKVTAVKCRELVWLGSWPHRSTLHMPMTAVAAWSLQPRASLTNDE